MKSYVIFLFLIIFVILSAGCGDSQAKPDNQPKDSPYSTFGERQRNQDQNIDLKNIFKRPIRQGSW